MDVMDKAASSWAVTFCMVAIVLYTVFVVIQLALDPLRAVPGPLPARVSRLWFLFKIYQGDFERTNIALHEKYGPIVRIAPNEYSIDDVDAARLIYGHKTTFLKAPWYLAWMPLDHNLASLFSDLDPHHHGAQRRKFATAYSMSSLIDYEPFVENCSALFVTRLCELADSNKTLDISHWLKCFAFDVIGEITFGQRFGFLDTGIDKDGVFDAIESRTAYSTHIGLFPALHRILFPLLPKTGGHAYVGQYTAKQIMSKESLLKDLNEKTRNGPADFVSKFLQVHESNSQKMTRTDIFTICQSNIGAGSDTTAITLSAILYFLLKNPASYKRLQEEIDDGITQGILSDPVTFKESRQLPYLQAVIREGLRLHSATGLPLARVVPASGAAIAGRLFPKGATVGINTWVAHRNRSVYGKDADFWRPERWLEIDQEGRGGEIERYFFAFGMGSRTCVGKNLSLLEVSKLIPQLLRQFDFVLAPELQQSQWKTQSRWFVKPLNFYGKVRLRNFPSDASKQHE